MSSLSSPRMRRHEERHRRDEAHVEQEREAGEEEAAGSMSPGSRPATCLPALTALTWKTSEPVELHPRLRAGGSSNSCAPLISATAVRGPSRRGRRSVILPWPGISIVPVRAREDDERCTDAARDDDRRARGAERLARDEVVAGEVFSLLFADVERARRREVRDVEHVRVPEDHHLDGGERARPRPRRGARRGRS